MPVQSIRRRLLGPALSCPWSKRCRSRESSRALLGSVEPRCRRRRPPIPDCRLNPSQPARRRWCTKRNPSRQAIDHVRRHQRLGWTIGGLDEGLFCEPLIAAWCGGCTNRPSPSLAIIIKRPDELFSAMPNAGARQVDTALVNTSPPMRGGRLPWRRLRPDIGFGAFISYSGQADADLIAVLQNGIEKLAKRWYRPPS